MAVWTLISLVAGMCWIGILVLGWMLCRAAKHGDEASMRGSLTPLSTERLPHAAQRQ